MRGALEPSDGADGSGNATPGRAPLKRKLREVYAAEDNAMEVGSGRSASNEDLSQQTPEVPAVESSCTHVVFAEFFAGSACLTDAVKAEGGSGPRARRPCVRRRRFLESG